MKRITLIAMLATVTFISCDKVKEIAKINQDVTYETSIPLPDSVTSTTLADTWDIAMPERATPTNKQKFVEDYKTSVNDIESASLRSTSLTRVGMLNFDFVNSVELYISSPGGGMPVVKIASKDNIAKGQTKLDLDINPDVNFKDYFLQDSISYMLKAKFNAQPEKGSILGITSTVNIVAKPLK